MYLPRYFLARSDAQASTAIPAVVAHAFDTFVIQSAGAACEWVAGLSDDGELTAQPVEPRTKLRTAVQAQLTFHETACQRRPPLSVESLYLFEAHRLASAPDLPGVNDPLYVDGRLIGPLVAGARVVTRRAGRLTITRADILHGLVSGAPAAFLHADTVTGKSARTYHALLPGDREEVLKQGHGGVLAYPSMGCDPALGPGNEPLVDEILYSVLRAVWRDVALENPPPLREPDELPVPSRSAHEMQLVSQGFRVKGDRAVRKKKGRLRGIFASERRRLPPQGTTSLFLGLAKEALAFMPTWPFPRITALTARVPPGPSGSAGARRGTHAGSDTARNAAAAGWQDDWVRRFLEAQDRRLQLMKKTERSTEDES